MLTTNEIFDSISALGGGGVARGRVRSAMRRQFGRAGEAPPPGQASFIKAYEAAAEQAQVEAPKPYLHPARNPERVMGSTRGERLPESLIAWMSALPSDPAEVTHEDARVLAGLSTYFAGPSASAADRLLVEQRWAPVREHHDALATRTLEQNTLRPLPPVPPGTLSALAEAVQAQHPGLGSEGALAEADALLQAFLDKRRVEHERALAIVEKRKAAESEAARRRAAVSA